MYILVIESNCDETAATIVEINNKTGQAQTVMPKLAYTTDKAAMIALAGYYTSKEEPKPLGRN